MPRKNKNKKNNNGNGGGRMVNVTGPGGFRLAFPIPRLPTWLGAANRLSANAAVYPRVDLDVPTIVVTPTAISAGALSYVLAVDPALLISGWVSRFSNTFREYCMVGLRLEFTLNSTTAAQGLVLCFIDETLATAPNAGSAYTPHMEIPLVSNPDGKVQLLEYRPTGSYTDLVWTPSTSTVPRQWVKLYASNAITGTGASTTGQIVIRGTMALAFRGFSNF